MPFSLEEIQRGAGSLAVVSKDADELSKILAITGNVATIAGVDFQTASEQIQRALTAGIASAEIFKERGVRDLLGFKAGATVTAEETAEAFERVFGKGGRFAGATDDLAITLSGTLSMLGDKLFQFQKVVAEQFLIGLKQEFGALDKALQDNEETIDKVAKAIGKGLSTAVIAVGKGFKFLAENFETIKAIGMGLVVAKITTSFLKLAIAIGRVRVAMIAFSRVSKTTVIGILAGVGLAVAEATGALDKMFEMFEQPRGIEDFRAEMEIIQDQFKIFEHNGVKGFDAVHESYNALMQDMKIHLRDAELTTNEMESLKNMLHQLETAYMAVPLETITVGMDEVTKKAKGQKKEIEELTGVYANFKKGFTDAFSTQKDMFKEIQEIGRGTFEGLKQSLTDFVMTGKLSFQDLSTFIVRKTVEMLIGQAIQNAFEKGMAMFKADAIKKAMISMYEGAMKTFASIPFPFNVVAVGGALAFGAGLINKIRGFERGGRPPVGRPSIVGEKGAELFVPDQAGTVVPNDKLGMNKNVTVNFNINTVDARGFNQLLVNSRGVIINLINSAMNEKGRMAVI